MRRLPLKFREQKIMKGKVQVPCIPWKYKKLFNYSSTTYPKNKTVSNKNGEMRKMLNSALKISLRRVLVMEGTESNAKGHDPCMFL